MLAQTHSAALSLLAWVVAGILSLLGMATPTDMTAINLVAGSVCYAELGTTFMESGGLGSACHVVI